MTSTIGTIQIRTMKNILLTLILAVTMLAGAENIYASSQYDEIFIPPCLSTETGMNTLNSISEKYKSNRQTGDYGFTQSEYAFMIQINQEWDAKCDETGASALYEETHIFFHRNRGILNIVEAFCVLVSQAYTEGKLDAANKKAFKKMMLNNMSESAFDRIYGE